MTVDEIPLVIQCHASSLIGILHKPQQYKKTGVVIVPAGGPQYRVGCARQIILWSRRLAQEGYPVLRFDYRGFGDSSGQFNGFEQIDDDIESAIKRLTREIPDIDSVVLWGECNAASSIMMYAWREPRIKALILQNPWVRNEMTQARTYIKHYYLMRILQRSFWLKLVKFQFNPFKSFTSLLTLWQQARGAKQQKNNESDFENLASFQDKMREGLARFNGKLLLFMSGYSLIGKEFDELVAVSERWQTILAQKILTRIDEPDADHTFSRAEDREKLISNAVQWLAKLQ
jgi:exosortase A-associated hydrolase 1